MSDRVPAPQWGEGVYECRVCRGVGSYVLKGDRFTEMRSAKTIACSFCEGMGFYRDRIPSLKPKKVA